MSMTASPEANTLQYIPCIHYPVQFQRGQARKVRALIVFGSEINIMNPAFADKLGLSISPTGIGAQKIDSSALKPYGMTIAGFSIQDKLGRARFFEKTFLLADTSMEVVLRMPFLTFSNVDIQFDTKSFIQRSYSAAEALPTPRLVELIDQYDFAKAALNKNSETFVVHIATLGVPRVTEVAGMLIYLDRANPVQVAALQQDITPTKIPPEYTDYTDIFSPDLAIELPENTSINKHAIELIESKYPPYGLIYNLGPVELEILKANIESHLKTGFIWSSKFPASAPILFDKKPDDSLCLCVDYRGLNSLTLKNRYLLPLIGKSLNRLGRAKRFTQLDLTSTFHRIRI